MVLPPLFDCHFPSYVKDSFNDQVDIYWYHPEFSQSRYPPGQEISEACTLICLFVAQRICQIGLLIWNVENCSEFNIIMAEAMAEGNATHAWIIRKGLIPHPYLNTEEALKFGGRSLSILREWKFRVFHENIKISLYRNIEHFLQEWYKHPMSENLFMLLITCGRTILFIFQQQTYKVILFDSHGHSSTEIPCCGLVVAQTTIDKLEFLCEWYILGVLNNCYNIQADQYELAFLYQHEVTNTGCSDSPCECYKYYEN